jgi:putative intracellular protease/amidase
LSHTADILLDRLNNTACVVFLDGRDFDAMLITDGHGIMWDGAYNSEIIRLVKEMYSSGKVLAAIGHGVGPLASVPVPEKANGYTHGFTNGYANGYTDTYSGRRQKYNGTRYIVTDKQVTASTNSEEAALGRSNLVPFLLESKLAKNGAAFTKGGDFRPYAVRAGQLVTGQNYASSRMVAECMVEALSLGVRMLSD